MWCHWARKSNGKIVWITWLTIIATAYFIFTGENSLREVLQSYLKERLWPEKALSETIICIIFVGETSNSSVYPGYSHSKTSWIVLYRGAQPGSVFSWAVVQVTQNNLKLLRFLAFLLNQPYSWCLLIKMVAKNDILLAELNYMHDNVMLPIDRIGLLQN